MKKKLIEVALPLEAINTAAVREKSIRHGHPSTLHLYWARRPLAACRAVLFAQLVDDPSSHPDKFPTEEAVEVERKRLFQIIENLVKWENTTNEEVLERARAEIRASCGGELPPVYDPFSGGGSIPLEAQRLGLPAHGSDLNPVAVTIGKAMVELPRKFQDLAPVHSGIREKQFYRYSEGLVEDLDHYGNWMREKAFERIGQFYPKGRLPSELGGGKAKVVAWIWARTVPSPDPAFADVQVPLVSSFLVGAKKGKEVWLEPIVDKVAKTIQYRVHRGGTEQEWEVAKEGTKAGRGNFRCLISDGAIPAAYIKSMGRSGMMGTQLLATVVEGNRGRIFLEPDEEQERTAFSEHVAHVAKGCRDTFLNGRTPSKMTGGTCYAYGLDEWGKLFTDRQLIGLDTYCQLIKDVREQIESDALEAGFSNDQLGLEQGGCGATAYAETVCVYLGLAISRVADISNSLCVWSSSANQAVHLFGRQAIPMVWSFAETSLFSGMAGDFLTSLSSIRKALLRFTPAADGFCVQQDAQSAKFPNGAVISTDPPYYDNIAYADLSDFFYPWMRRSLKSIYPSIYDFLATPKFEELVAASYRHGGKEEAESFFLSGMTKAISSMAQNASDEFPSTIYYAFKQSEIKEEGISSTGWATFLSAVIESGYSIVGTWPVRTERDTGLKVGKNVLANSVVLVCRKRKLVAEVVTRAEFIRALKRELPPAIEELQAASVSPADMPQSAIGPGMGVFSRYKAVLEADDGPMTVKTALQLINAELDEFLNDLHGEFDADTRFAASWFQQNGYDKGEYGAADNLARARGISVESVKHAGIIESSAGKVRILKRAELDSDWDPEEDTHLTIWECCQYLIRTLENDGEYAAAELLKKIGSERAETVKDLAYYLYDVCGNKRQDAKEATSYNGLIAVWTDLTRLAATIHVTDKNSQTRMDI
jgi:putative DNA methylase